MAPRRRTAEEIWAMLLPPDENGCRLWPTSGSNGGYGKTWFQGQHYLAHQLAFYLANGWVPRGRRVIVRHTCDQPRCCEPTHLVVGTQKENARDRDSRGRSNLPPSWKKWNAACTPAQVREIRTLYAQGGWSYPKLGKKFGLHPQNIGRIVRREGYADVT